MTYQFMAIFYGPEEAPEAKELGQKSPEPTTRLEGAPYPPGASSTLVGETWTPLTCSRRQHLLYIPKPLEQNLDREFRRRKPL